MALEKIPAALALAATLALACTSPAAQSDAGPLDGALAPGGDFDLAIGAAADLKRSGADLARHADLAQVTTPGGYGTACDVQICSTGYTCYSVDPSARPFCAKPCTMESDCMGLGDWVFCIGSYCSTYCDNSAGGVACASGTTCTVLIATMAGICTPD